MSYNLNRNYYDLYKGDIKLFEWVIIGGGVHGCTIANYLIKSGKTKIDELLIIDPHKEPMEKWKKFTSRIGKEYLCSPSVHHIDVNAFSL